ncbi:MAG: aldehyde-activating protein [Pseudomonadota bacterium]
MGEQEDQLVETQCLCGAVKVAIEAPPIFVQDCNCRLCRNSGAVWGYFTVGDVLVSGDTSVFVRPDRELPAVAIHSCPSCHATTHWTLTEEYRATAPDADRLGVNMRLFSGDAMNGVEVRFPDGERWDGKGDFGFRRPSFIASDAQKF